MLAAQTHAASDEYVQRLRAGMEEASRGDFSAAMADLEDAVRLEPGEADGWYEIGVLYGQIGDFRGAESAFRHSLQLKPNQAKTHYRLGLTLIANPQSKLDWPSAITEFRAALKIQPDYSEALNYLGAGLIDTGETNAAIPELEHALRLAPSLAAAHFNLAIALERSNRLDEAVKEYQTAIADKNNYAEAGSALGKLLFRIGRAAEAEKALMQALRWNPDLGDAHYALGRLLQSLKRNTEAAVEFEQAKDLAQREPDAIESSRLSNEGLSLAAKGDFTGAVKQLREAVKLRPSYGVPHYNLGLLLADSGDMPGAVEQLTQAISLLPGQAKPWFELGRVLQRQGDNRAAFHAISWAGRLAPADSAVRGELASLQATDPALKQDSPSIRPAEGSVADTAADHLAFASQLMERRDFTGAVGELLRSLALQPGQVGARRSLAGAYERLGDTGRAALEYHKLLLLLPDDADAHAALTRLQQLPVDRP